MKYIKKSLSLEKTPTTSDQWRKRSDFERIELIRDYLKSSEKNKGELSILNIGGDEELSYENMLERIKENLSKESLQKKCFLIKIPNRIFFLIFSPIILISPKYYASILRISMNMGGFQPSYKIHGKKEAKFPLRIKK